MKLLQDKVNVEPVSAEYPFGDIKNNTGTNNGTNANRELFQEGFQLFEKVFGASGIVANGLPDNTTNGFQLYEAFRKLFKPYVSYTAYAEQGGVVVPVFTEKGLNDLGNIVWSYNGVGSYYGTLAGAFPDGSLLFICNNGIAGLSEVDFRRLDDNTVEIRTYSGGSPSNGVLSDLFEIRRYS